MPWPTSSTPSRTTSLPAPSGPYVPRVMPGSPPREASPPRAKSPSEIKSPPKDAHSPTDPRMRVPHTANVTHHRRVTPCSVKATPQGVSTGRITKTFLPLAREKLVIKAFWNHPVPEPGPTAELTDDENLWVFQERMLFYDGLLPYLNVKMHNHALEAELEAAHLEKERIAREAAKQVWFENFRKLTKEQQAQEMLDRVLDVTMPVPK